MAKSGVSMKTSEILSDSERDEMDTSSMEAKAEEKGKGRKQDSLHEIWTNRYFLDHMNDDGDDSDTMQKIRKEYAELKDSLFENSISWLEADIQKVRSGNHGKFMEGTKDLELAREEKRWRIEQWKKYRMENIEKWYEAENQQANDEYEADKQLLQKEIENNFEDKLCQLKEEKKTLSHPDPSELRPATTRQLRKRAKESKEFKQRKLQPAHITVCLQDSDIAEDLNVMTRFHPTDPEFDREKWLAFLDE